MNYFFDESGNWLGKEYKYLILGGLLIKDNSIEKRLDREFKLFKSENGIKSLHAVDLSEEQKEKIYQIIYKILDSEDVITIIRFYNKDTTFKKTTKQADQIYAELAADLINTLSFGDSDVNIFYDMKFHYAYPANIIDNINTRRPYFFKDIKNNFQLKEDAFIKARKKIQSQLLFQINKKQSASNKMMQSFLDSISDKEFCINPFEKKDMEILENKKLIVKEKISEYLWSELWLQMEGKIQAVENFRYNIEKKFRDMNKSFSANLSLPFFKIKFSNKYEENPGIQMIDIICNLLYRQGIKYADNSSGIVKKIYSKLIIEEYFDEI